MLSNGPGLQTGPGQAVIWAYIGPRCPPHICAGQWTEFTVGPADRWPPAKSRGQGKGAHIGQLMHAPFAGLATTRFNHTGQVRCLAPFV